MYWHTVTEAGYENVPLYAHEPGVLSLSDKTFATLRRKNIVGYLQLPYASSHTTHSQLKKEVSLASFHGTRDGSKPKEGACWMKSAGARGVSRFESCLHPTWSGSQQGRQETWAVVRTGCEPAEWAGRGRPQQRSGEPSGK